MTHRLLTQVLVVALVAGSGGVAVPTAATAADPPGAAPTLNGLPAGAHTIAVTVTDTLGNTAAGLAPATSYAWVESARTADDGVAAAQPAVFRTAKGQPVVTATSSTVEWGTAVTVTVEVAAGQVPVSGTVSLYEGEKPRGSAAPSGGATTFRLPVNDQLNPAQGTVTVAVNLPPA